MDKVQKPSNSKHHRQSPNSGSRPIFAPCAYYTALKMEEVDSSETMITANEIRCHPCRELNPIKYIVF
jgi:hypothetical protein